jgi:hypothetical protein
VPLRIYRSLDAPGFSDGISVLSRVERSTNGTGQDLNDQVPTPDTEITPAQSPMPAGLQQRNQPPRTDVYAPTSTAETFQEEQPFPDPEWLRAVTNAFGPGGVQQVHQESLRVMMERQRADSSPQPLPGQQQPVLSEVEEYLKRIEEEDRRRHIVLIQRQKHAQNQLERAHHMGGQP